MSVMELYYISLQELGEDAAHRILILVRSLPVKELSLTDDLVLAAADLKARYRISVADAWIAATARVRALTLIHKDPEFEPLKDEVAMKELPFRLSRPRKRRT